MSIKTFTIHGQEIKKDKQKFIACSAFIGDRWYKIKFTKECEKAPKEKGLYELTVDLNNCSLENGKSYTAKDGTVKPANSIIWIRKIDNIRKYNEEELAERNRVVMEGIFGE